MKLNQDPQVAQLAYALKLKDWSDRPVHAVVDYCHEKIRGWTKGRELHSIADLERLVCSKLKLVFEEIHFDEDLVEIIKKYRALGEFAFLSIKDTFDESTFAVLLERRHVNASSPDRYVAVVDCRGEKANRCYFSRWHEIAHLLTLTKQLDLPFHRSTEDVPLERLMDMVAGEVGFFAPVFQPVLQKQITDEGRLTFDVVEAVRREACPDASFQSTLFACLRQASQPAVWVEMGLGFKKAEKDRLDSRNLSLFPAPRPVPMLRALKTLTNESARSARLRINQNMRIPSESLASRHYKGIADFAVDPGVSGNEDLALWRHSDGTSVGEGQIHLEARRFGKSFFVLITRS